MAHESKSKNLSLMQKKKKLNVMSGRDEKRLLILSIQYGLLDDEKKNC